MNVDIHKSWKPLLQSEFKKTYFKELMEFVKNEYQSHTCYPPGKHIFAAFDWCAFDDLNVVIIGQDPYHGVSQANGLCFSVNDDVPHPPSLMNIFKEIEADIGSSYPTSGNLERWASPGVFLLHAPLNVRAGEAGSHQGKGWEQFTDAVITRLSESRDGIVFLLWGGFARKKAARIDPGRHHLLHSGHPSPLSANRGYWFGNKHFSQTNDLLKANGVPPINW